MELLKENLSPLIARRFNAKISKISSIDSGANGRVYKVSIDKAPYAVAVKVAENFSLLSEERANIMFLRERADIKLPEIYFSDEKNSLICMQFFDGTCCDKPPILRMPPAKRQALAVAVCENLEKLQAVKGEKYGRVNDARFDNWHDYYRVFALNSLRTAFNAANEGMFPKKVAGLMEKAFSHYDDIFDEPISKPTLIHGDYWGPNLIARGSELVGVVDPFNILWADNEYELFALNAVDERKLGFYKTFKSRNAVSVKCDLKCEFYALFSEVYWYSLTHNKFDKFLILKARLLWRQLKRFKII